VSALTEINRNSDAYDAAVILRGGGSKLDLAGFDREAIGESIAFSKLPILVGIGHETDQTLPDLLAHSNFKTPTALAEFVVQRSANFESSVQQHVRQIARAAERLTATKRRMVQQLSNGFQQQINIQLFQSQRRLDTSAQLLRSASRQFLQGQSRNLAELSTVLDLLNPVTLLARGYALVSRNNQRITTSANLVSDDVVDIRFSDSTVKAKIL